MRDMYSEYPEARGKTIEELRYYNDPATTPEVHIRFTDGTSVSLKLCQELKLDVEFYRMQDGDIKVVHRYPEG